MSYSYDTVYFRSKALTERYLGGLCFQYVKAVYHGLMLVPIFSSLMQNLNLLLYDFVSQRDRRPHKCTCTTKNIKYPILLFVYWWLPYVSNIKANPVRFSIYLNNNQFKITISNLLYFLNLNFVR